MDSLRERALRGYPDAMAALAEAGEDLTFLSPEQRACGWCQTFHPRLAEGMAPCPTPLLYNFLCLLKLGRKTELSLATVEFWLEAAVCPDPEVKRRARKRLRAIKPNLVDRLCEYVLTRRCSLAAREFWVDQGRLPSSPPQQQIYLIRMGLTDRAEELDPQGLHLVQGALELRPPWRLALAAHLRERGRGHLVPRMLGIVRDDIQLDDAMVGEMLRQQQFEALWGLVPFLSTERAGELIGKLAQHGFQGGPDFARALELIPSPRGPVAVLPRSGRFLGWGGSRILCNEEGLVRVRALDWREGRSLWQSPRGASFSFISPDGQWAVIKRKTWELLDPEGRSVPQRGLSKGYFSPCSRYLAFAQGQRGRILELATLQTVHGEWQPEDRWFADGVVVREEEGSLRFRNLATGATWEEAYPLDDPPAHHWRKSAHGERWVATLDASQESLVVESDGSFVVMLGSADLLADGRVLCRNKLWDGRLVRPLPELDPAWEVAGVDLRCGRRILRGTPVGPRPRSFSSAETMARYLASSRLQSEREGTTGLTRLFESRPYRELPGRFQAVHPREPYLLTSRNHEFSIWHIPAEIPLGSALLEDNARQLDEPLRPLALFLLHRRFRNEVSLEESLALSAAHDIQLG